MTKIYYRNHKKIIGIPQGHSQHEASGTLWGSIPWESIDFMSYYGSQNIIIHPNETSNEPANYTTDISNILADYMRSTAERRR